MPSTHKMVATTCFDINDTMPIFRSKPYNMNIIFYVKIWLYNNYSWTPNGIVSGSNTYHHQWLRVSNDIQTSDYFIDVNNFDLHIYKIDEIRYVIELYPSNEFDYNCYKRTKQMKYEQFSSIFNEMIEYVNQATAPTPKDETIKLEKIIESFTQFRIENVQWQKLPLLINGNIVNYVIMFIILIVFLFLGTHILL